ncbi:hypothetical protein B0H17DRAFT_1125669 [Mycena rosella]|uniref:Uncharacterized protein n=1 Tax=Mycena rosella TaxID=1033263 RepID=A0AAD7M9F2_MYCRO|nr:hypothetical protein B0H17DRAFT_1125669 [Mycena rosella]
MLEEVGWTRDDAASTCDFSVLPFCRPSVCLSIISIIPSADSDSSAIDEPLHPKPEPEESTYIGWWQKPAPPPIARPRLPLEVGSNLESWKLEAARTPTANLVASRIAVAADGQCRCPQPPASVRRKEGIPSPLAVRLSLTDSQGLEFGRRSGGCNPALTQHSKRGGIVAGAAVCISHSLYHDTTRGTAKAGADPYAGSYTNLSVNRDGLQLIQRPQKGNRFGGRRCNAHNAPWFFGLLLLLPRRPAYFAQIGQTRRTIYSTLVLKIFDTHRRLFGLGRLASIIFRGSAADMVPEDLDLELSVGISWHASPCLKPRHPARGSSSAAPNPIQNPRHIQSQQPATYVVPGPLRIRVRSHIHPSIPRTGARTQAGSSSTRPCPALPSFSAMDHHYSCITPVRRLLIPPQSHLVNRANRPFVSQCPTSAEIRALIAPLALIQKHVPAEESVDGKTLEIQAIRRLSRESRRALVNLATGEVAKSARRNELSRPLGTTIASVSSHIFDRAALFNRPDDTPRPVRNLPARLIQSTRLNLQLRPTLNAPNTSLPFLAQRSYRASSVQSMSLDNAQPNAQPNTHLIYDWS